MVGALCLALAAGSTFIVLPTSSLTLRWTHSVERTRWEEDYAVTPDGLAIIEARVEAVGAGMEPPSGAVREGRWWRYRPSLPPLDTVAFANTTFADGYTICWNSQCRSLNAFVPKGTPFKLTASDCLAEPLGSPLPECNRSKPCE